MSETDVERAIVNGGKEIVVGDLVIPKGAHGWELEGVRVIRIFLADGDKLRVTCQVFPEGLADFAPEELWKLDDSVIEFRAATKVHRGEVAGVLSKVIAALTDRQINHDASKLQLPELVEFPEHIEALKAPQYGSPKYAEALERMGPVLKHHYEENRHHPEHFDNGINDMTLMDLLEMLADWMSASKRSGSDSIYSSLAKNVSRFGISEQLYIILKNTVRALEAVNEH